MNSLSKIGLLCTVIAAVVMVPGVAVGECDYIGALEGYSLSEFEYSGLDQAAIDAAPSYVLPEGGTVDIDLPPFGDVVHLVGGTECGPPGEFWVLWDHEDASTYSWPDGPSDQQQGGGDGVGDDPYGLYMIMGETRTLFTVVAGEPEPEEPEYAEAYMLSSLTFFEEDADVNFTAVGTASDTPGYTWTFDGGALPEGATADGAALSIEGLDDPTHIGTYACTWEDGVEEKGTQNVSIEIAELVPAGSVPATNYLGLTVLAVLSALFGAVALRRQVS